MDDLEIKGLQPSEEKTEEDIQEMSEALGAQDEQTQNIKPPEKQDARPLDDARVEALVEEANELRRITGVNMVEIMREDQTIQAKVATGEWGMAMAYAYYLRRQGQGMPQTIRSSGGGQAPRKTLENMSSTEFDQLEKRLGKGQRFRAE
ncbi:MAG: hypothetical protein RR482_05740 [Clostridia bacterium]